MMQPKARALDRPAHIPREWTARATLLLCLQSSLADQRLKAIIDLFELVSRGVFADEGNNRRGVELLLSIACCSSARIASACPGVQSSGMVISSVIIVSSGEYWCRAASQASPGR